MNKIKKLSITYASFPDFSSNAKPLYEYMSNKYSKQMDFTWVVRTDEMLDKLKMKGIKTIKFRSNEYYKHMKNSDVIFTTHGDLISEKNKKALYIELWHGISPKNIGFLSNNITERDKKWFLELKREVDYFIVPSDFWRIIFSARFNIEYDRALSLGYPKLDYLVNSPSKKNLKKILNCDIEKYKKIIYYMPTFRKGSSRFTEDSNINPNNIFNINDYDENKLYKFLKNNNYLLCIKKHPSEEKELNIIENDNIRIITEQSLVDNYISINEILSASDLLITDYSSLGIEFIFLNKPIIYLDNDVDEYKKNRGITFDNLDFWTNGKSVSEINKLLSLIHSNLNNETDFEKKLLQNQKKVFFSNLKDGGCDKICEFIFDKNGNINDNILYYKDAELNLINKIENMKKSNIKNTEEIKRLKNELSEIYNSKCWKFINKTSIFINKLKVKKW